MGGLADKLKRTVIFFREEGWYPVELKPGEKVETHVALNPGTRRVEDVRGNILWQEPTNV